MCSLFLVLRLLITKAVRSSKKKAHQRLLLWEVSVMQQRLLRIILLIAARRNPAKISQFVIERQIADDTYEKAYSCEPFVLIGKDS